MSWNLLVTFLDLARPLGQTSCGVSTLSGAENRRFPDLLCLPAKYGFSNQDCLDGHDSCSAVLMYDHCPPHAQILLSLVACAFRDSTPGVAAWLASGTWKPFGLYVGQPLLADMQGAVRAVWVLHVWQLRQPADLQHVLQMLLDCCAGSACQTLKSQYTELQDTDPKTNPDYCAIVPNVCTE